MSQFGIFATRDQSYQRPETRRDVHRLAVETLTQAGVNLASPAVAGKKPTDLVAQLCCR